MIYQRPTNVGILTEVKMFKTWSLPSKNPYYRGQNQAIAFVGSHSSSRADKVFTFNPSFRGPHRNSIILEWEGANGGMNQYDQGKKFPLYGVPWLTYLLVLEWIGSIYILEVWHLKVASHCVTNHIGSLCSSLLSPMLVPCDSCLKGTVPCDNSLKDTAMIVFLLKYHIVWQHFLNVWVIEITELSVFQEKWK